MDNQNEKTSVTALQKSKSSTGIKIPVEKNGTLELIDYSGFGGHEIANNKTAFSGLSHYMLATRPNGDWNTEFEPELLRDMLKEKQVTVKEAITAFKKAYSDHYTPRSGIEWRHLWKHIEEMRMGKDRQYYTYQEMLNIVDRENITTDHFQFIGKDQWKRK